MSWQRKRWRDTRRLKNSNALLAAGVPCNKQYGRFRYVESIGEERDQRGIRLAIGGRRRKAYLETVTVQPGKLIFCCARLYVQAELQIAVTPPAPSRKGVHTELARCRIGGIRSILSTCSATAATSGERSSPPKGGMRRRAGRNIGSLRLYNMAMTGL